MGWATDTYFRVYKADVNKVENGKGLEVYFHRRFTDGRDQMSNCLRPSWEPVDKFIIHIAGWTERQEVEEHQNKSFSYTVTKTIRENHDSFEVRTESKQMANWIWYLAAKQGLTFDQLKAMNEPIPIKTEPLGSWIQPRGILLLLDFPAAQSGFQAPCVFENDGLFVGGAVIDEIFEVLIECVIGCLHIIVEECVRSCPQCIGNADESWETQLGVSILYV